jgi:hypothetical protein
VIVLKGVRKPAFEAVEPIGKRKGIRNKRFTVILASLSRCAAVWRKRCDTSALFRLTFKAVVRDTMSP